MKMMVQIMIGGVWVCLAGGVAHGDTVTLRASARLSHDEPVVYLRDVAVLDGERATALGDVVLSPVGDTSRVLELSREAIRATLENAGAHWGMIDLNGGAVTVRPRAAGGDLGPPVVMQPLAIDSRELSPIEMEPLFAAEDLLAEPTLRGEVVRVLVRHLAVTAANLRVRFDASDADVLDRSTTECRYEVHPRSGAASDRMVLDVRGWRNNNVEDERSITVHPQVRCSAAQAVRDLSRGDVVLDRDIDVSMQWLAPSMAARMIDPISAVGRTAKTTVDSGDLLYEQHLEVQMLIERGDAVTVRCLVGGLAITQPAIARSEGGAGEVIELRRAGERESFYATVTGRGEVIVDLGNRSGAGVHVDSVR